MASIQFDIYDDAMIRMLWRVTGEIAVEKGGRVGIGTAAGYIVETVLTHPEIYKQVLELLESSTVRTATLQAPPKKHK